MPFYFTTTILYKFVYLFLKVIRSLCHRCCFVEDIARALYLGCNDFWLKSVKQKLTNQVNEWHCCKCFHWLWKSCVCRYGSKYCLWLKFVRDICCTELQTFRMSEWAVSCTKDWRKTEQKLWFNPRTAQIKIKFCISLNVWARENYLKWENSDFNWSRNELYKEPHTALRVAVAHVWYITMYNFQGFGWDRWGW